MTALDFYKSRLKGSGFTDKQIQDLTSHKDLGFLEFAEEYYEAKKEWEARRVGDDHVIVLDEVLDERDWC